MFNLRTLRQEYYPRLYPVESFVIMMSRQMQKSQGWAEGELQEENKCNKDWGDMTSSQGNFYTLLETVRGKEKEGIFPSSLHKETTLSIPHFRKTHFEILISRSVNEYICVDLSHYFCSCLFQLQ